MDTQKALSSVIHKKISSSTSTEFKIEIKYGAQRVKAKAIFLIYYLIGSYFLHLAHPLTTCTETSFEFYAHTIISQQSHCPSIRPTYFGWGQSWGFTSRSTATYFGWVLEVMLLCCFYLYFIEYVIVIEF